MDPLLHKIALCIILRCRNRTLRLQGLKVRTPQPTVPEGSELAKQHPCTRPELLPPPPPAELLWPGTLTLSGKGKSAASPCLARVLQRACPEPACSRLGCRAKIPDLLQMLAFPAPYCHFPANEPGSFGFLALLGVDVLSRA